MSPPDTPESALARLARTPADVALAAFVCGLAAAGALGMAIALSGAFDISAAVPHSRLAYWALNLTKTHSVRRHAAKVAAPRRFPAEAVARGFALYDADCVVCHGAPGIGPGRLAEGLNPTPPYLIEASRRWRAGELYWIIRNGEKMTAMPGWHGQLTSGQTWDLVAFIEALPRTTYPAYLEMRRQAAARACGTSPSPPPAACADPEAPGTAG